MKRPFQGLAALARRVIVRKWIVYIGVDRCCFSVQEEEDLGPNCVTMRVIAFALIFKRKMNFS